MTIYAFEDGPSKTVVAAATTVSEFDSFYSGITSQETKEDFVAEFQPDFMLMMTDPVFSKFKKPPIIVEHADTSQRSEFVRRLGIEIVGRNTAISRHDSMLNKVIEEKEAAAPPSEKKTIAELLGIETDDPWDRRSDEEKAAEEERKKQYHEKYKDAQGKGNMSGDSFDAPVDKDTAHVSDIRTTIMPDGSIVIDHVRAVKGLHDSSIDQITEAEARVAASSGKDVATFEGYYYAITTGSPAGEVETVVLLAEKTFFDANSFPNMEDENDDLANVMVSHGFKALQPGVFSSPVSNLTEPPAKRLLERLKMDANSKLQDLLDKNVPRTNEHGETENFDENGDNIAVANDGLVPIYFKLEVTGKTMEEVAPIFVAANFPIAKHASVMRNHKLGCWFASVRKKSAEDAQELLAQAGVQAEVYAIAENGERLIENIAGVTVVDTGASAETPVRPWNDRAFEWDLMTDTDREANRQTWKGEEFIFTGQYTRETGCVITICPKDYFEKHGTTYPERLDIMHLLPQDLKEIDLWLYQTTSRDWNSFTYDMSVKRHFAENWFLQLHLNSLS